MNNMLQQGIAALKAGRRVEARDLLKQVIQQDEHNEMAWLWLSGAVDTDRERRTCLENVLAINPNNQTARRGLESLIAKEGIRPLDQAVPLAEHSTPSTTSPASQAQPPAAAIVAPDTTLSQSGAQVIKLHCPSCNGALELPNNLDVTHCMYCGTKILVQQAETARERHNLKRYTELCRVAIEAKNYEEAIRYCNSILEIDPRNIQAWVDKATSTFQLTTGANNRYDEAVEYLRKAAQIAPGDPRVTGAYQELNQLQARWYNFLGNDAFKLAEKVFGIYGQGNYTDLEDLFVDQVSGYSKANARQHSSEYYVQAMEYYLRASDYAPDDMTILENIAGTAKRAHWISWSKKVSDKMQTLERLKAKSQALAALPGLREELKNAKATLARLKKEKGLISGLKVKDAERKVKNIQAEIAKWEKAAAYEAPQAPCKL